MTSQTQVPQHLFEMTKTDGEIVKIGHLSDEGTSAIRDVGDWLQKTTYTEDKTCEVCSDGEGLKSRLQSFVNSFKQHTLVSTSLRIDS